MPSRLDQVEYLKRAEQVHHGVYDYSCLVYKNALTKVDILCPKHGRFTQLPFNHLKGVGCPSCGAETRANGISLDTDDFISKADKVHQGKYDYSRVNYTGYNNKVEILCPVHGSFLQRANNHLAGVGCRECGYRVTSSVLLKPQTEFVSTATLLHEGKYDYSFSVYQGAFAPLEVICPVHGGFWQTPDAHLNSGSGCPRCSHRYSTQHKSLFDFIQGLGAVGCKLNDRSAISPYELDIFVPHSFGVEFNGRFWHSLTAATTSTQARYRHRDKFNLCQQKGILLLQIDEHEWGNPTTREVWKSVIASKLGCHQRIPARKTEFQPISSIEANAFFAVNHLQGVTPAIRWSFGLFYQGELVGVISYCYHEHTRINLSRLAFRLNTTVVGGAQKLFKGSLPLLPAGEILSFSNNQYSNGAIYPLLGFAKVADLPPSYQWYFKGRIWNKRSLRKNQLAKLLPDFNPNETEHQNLYRNGARCLYDAGYQKWVFCRGN